MAGTTTFSGTRLRSLRTAAGLRREQVAVAIGRSYHVEVRWEQGAAVPDTNDLARLGELLRVDVEQLFDEVPAAVA